MDLKSIIRNPSRKVEVPNLPLGLDLGIKVNPKAPSIKDKAMQRPEYSMLEGMLNGTLNPYTFFPYTSGRKHVVIKRWSDYFEKEYRKVFIRDCRETFEKLRLEHSPDVTMNELNRALKKENSLPTPYKKGEGATFFLSIIASHLFCFVDPDILLKSEEEREMYKQNGLVWQQKWFEGLFKDPIAMKEKTPALVRYISECMPFRPASKSLTQYLNSKGAMSFESFITLVNEEAQSEFFQWEFALIMKMFNVAQDQLSNEKERDDIDQKKAEEVYNRLVSIFFSECQSITNRIITKSENPVEIAFFRLVQMGLKEYVLNLTPTAEELAEAVSDFVMVFFNRPKEDLESFISTELENLKKNVGLYFTFLTTGELSRYGEYIKMELVNLMTSEVEEEPVEEEPVEQQQQQQSTPLNEGIEQKENMPTSIHLAHDLLSKLDKVADTQNLSRSEVIRRSLEQTLDATSDRHQKHEAELAELKAQLERYQDEVKALQNRPSLVVKEETPKPFIINGVEFYLDKGSKGTINANGVNLLGLTLPPSDMVVTIKSFNSFELSRP